MSTNRRAGEASASPANAKVVYGGAEWIAALNRNLADLTRAAGDEIGGRTFRLCEIVKDAPEDLADPARNDGSRAWHIVIDGANSYAMLGQIGDVDYGVVLEYQAILPIARWDYAAADHDPAALEAYRAKLASSGAYRAYGRLASIPPPFDRLLTELHNRMARITA